MNMALEKNGVEILSKLGDYGEEISGNMMRMNFTGASGKWVWLYKHRKGDFSFL